MFVCFMVKNSKCLHNQKRVTQFWEVQNSNENPHKLWHEFMALILATKRCVLNRHTNFDKDIFLLLTLSLRARSILFPFVGPFIISVVSEHFSFRFRVWIPCTEKREKKSENFKSKANVWFMQVLCSSLASWNCIHQLFAPCIKVSMYRCNTN